MKITVSLDTQAVITQPSPLRIKAGAFVPVAIAFTRASQTMALPQGAVVEFALKPRNQWTGGLLAYLNAFDLAAGNVYTGTLNGSSTSLLGALGLNDSMPLNDLPQLEASAEVTWSVGIQKFRSATFPVIVEAPVTDDNPIPTPDPELYPSPGEIALKREIPVVGTAAKLDAGAPGGAATLDDSGKLDQDQIPDTVAFKSELPVVGSAARLDAGVPNGAATLNGGGKLVEDQVPDSVALKTELPVFATTAEATDGARADVMMSPLDVAFWFNAKLSGNAGVAFLGDASWGLPDLAGYTGMLAGDGTNVTGVTSIGLISPFGNQFYDSGTGLWISSSALQTPAITGIHGASFSDDFGTWLFANGIQAPWFSGDGTNLSNLTAFQLISPWGCSIFDSGSGNWQVEGSVNADWLSGSFSGDGSSLSNLTAYQISGPYGYSIYDGGWGSWQIDGGINTGWINASFNGDGSNLYNVTASQINSPYGYAIYDSGWGSWQVNGWINGSFSGDGSGLYSVGYAQNAYADEYGTEIASNYVQQWGYYYGLSVGNADWASNCYYAYNTDWANSANYASNASWDSWGYQLYGAGNIQWDFFGGSPNPGDVPVFDGNYWSPAPAVPLPVTVDDTVGRFATSGLRTGSLVKQLDNRTVYQVLDPNDCATELGWVPVGPFILVPANSTPLVIDNTSPVFGNTIHCTAGTWSDNPASYAYQWNRNGSAISGATALAYTVVAADDGASLQCVVSATNAAGTGTDNASIPLVVLNAPTNTTAPAITPAGTPNVADTLSLTSGTWTGYGYTTTYQWKRAGTAIAGATAATYTLVATDAGQTITCTVTRTNIRGNASATTSATPAVTNLIAVNTAAPTLSSTFPYTGLLMTCSPGTWNYHPTSYSYQWKRSGTAISGATASTYTVVAADVGSTISCSVTATNAAGTGMAVSTAESNASTAAAVSPIQGAIASGLIAHWSLDESTGNRMDSSGNGINLTPYANGGTITNAAGKFGMAASIPPRSYFAATDSRLANAKTICGWFKLTAANTSYQRLLFSNIQVYSGSSGVAWDATHYSTGIVPTPGQWYFVCAVVTGTTIKLWVNNQSFSVQTVASGSSLIGSTLNVADPSYESVTMLFDEVAVWNRALTDAEIATLAAS